MRDRVKEWEKDKERIIQTPEKLRNKIFRRICVFYEKDNEDIYYFINFNQ